MKILYVTARFYPYKSGGERNILALAERMVAEGHDVTVYTCNIKFSNEELSKYETYKGIKIVRHWALNESLYAGFYPELFFALLSNQFDVIHTSGIGFFWREFCLIIKKIVSSKTKFITTPHGPYMAANYSTGFRSVAKKVGTLWLSLYLNWLFNIFISVAPKQVVWMKSEYGIDSKKVKLVPNGIDKDYIEKDIIKHDKTEKVVITYMNRMEEYKGIQQVLKALASLQKFEGADSKMESCFYIMGRPGNYTSALERMVKEFKLEENVKFIFSPSDEERDLIFYKESQINILPSKWEGTGIAVIEAMAKGNIAITTFQNEAADLIIDDGTTGFIYDYEDTDRLAEILKLLITDYQLREKMRELNLEKAKGLTWEAVFGNYKEIIEKII